MEREEVGGGGREERKEAAETQGGSWGRLRQQTVGKEVREEEHSDGRSKRAHKTKNWTARKEGRMGSDGQKN